jgi:hypothetical protein
MGQSFFPKLHYFSHGDKMATTLTIIEGETFCRWLEEQILKVVSAILIET